MSLGAVDYVYVILACLSMIFGLLLVALFWKVRELQKGPGQLILGQCIAQLVLDLHWMTYDKVWRGLGSYACKVLGCIGLAAYVIAFDYAVAVCIVAYRHFYEPFLEKSTHKWYHLICISTGLVVGIVVAACGETGHSVMHTCFTRHPSGADVILLLVLVVWTTFGLVISFFFIIKFRTNQRFTINSLIVVLVFAIAWVGPSIYHFLAMKGIDHEPDNNGFKNFSMLTGAMSGFLCVLARFAHRPIWEGIMSLFRKQEPDNSMEFL